MASRGDLSRSLELPRAEGGDATHGSVDLRWQPALALPADATLCVQHGYRFKGSWNDSQAGPVADGVTCTLYR